MNILPILMKSKRKEMMMTQSEMAKSLGMSIVTYNSLEKGRRKHCAQRATIRKVAVFLGLTDDVVWRMLNDRD